MESISPQFCQTKISILSAGPPLVPPWRWEVGEGARWEVGEGVRWDGVRWEGGEVGEGVRWEVGEGVRWEAGEGVRVVFGEEGGGWKL